MNISFKKSNKYILLLILIIYPTYSYDHWTNVTDETFIWETSYDDVKWLLFFHKEDCNKCNEVYSLLNIVMKKYMDKKIGFILIDSKECPWLVNRFNISYLPKIILLENNLMYNFHSNYNEKNIINFIDKKKKFGLPIPRGARIKNIYRIYCSLLSRKINFSMQYFLDKLHIPLKWNKYYTLFFAGIIFIFIIIMIFFTMILCCKIIKGLCCCRLCRRKSKKITISTKIQENQKIKEKIE